MRLVENHQRRPPQLAREVDERIEKQVHELAPLAELQLVKIDYGGHFVLDQPSRQECGVARIGQQLATRADQQHIHCLAQACELAFVIEDNRLDAGTFSNES